MIEHMTPDRIANAILQDNSYKGLYVLVEGKKDCKVFGKFLDINNTRIRPTFGCQKLLEVFDILNQRGFEEKIGILDKDFIEIVGVIPQIDNIFYTDYHDVEIMIFETKAFDDILRVYSVQDKIERFEHKTGKKIRDIIFEVSDNIGYLKLIEKKNQFGLKFKPEKIDGKHIKYNDFITDKFEYKGDDILVNSIINYSRNRTNKQLFLDQIKEKLTLEKNNEYDSRHLSNGHDISNLVFILLKKTLRCNNSMLNDFNCVEDSLILAYEYEDFKESELHKKLIEWSKKNNKTLLR